MGCTNCYSGDMWWVLVWDGLKGFVMGRVIKFRAWDGEIMHDKNVCLIEGGFAVSEDSMDWVFNFDAGFGKPDLIGMQFTGLTDKNDVEIFEGDIVNMPIDGEWFIIDVSFDVDRDLNGWNVIPQHVNDGIEVIGNIHQNPELLK